MLIYTVAIYLIIRIPPSCFSSQHRDKQWEVIGKIPLLSMMDRLSLKTLRPLAARSNQMTPLVTQS